MKTVEAGKKQTAAEKELERWEQETLRPALEKMPERKEKFEGVSLEPVERLYTEAHTADITVGFPGEYPYKRGIHPTGYR
ncbi:methylmalonyl-CoA mutase family protein, partial [Escherichia coli]|nr:methylmalonyl-CoA mutase family protein [Escherichia coli]